MRVKKIAAPFDFGVDNLALPNHLNVTLHTANDREVKANSLVLSYNSRVLKRMFKESEPCNSIDLKEYSRNVVDKFVKMLYSGTVDFERLPFLRDIWKLADTFNVKWLLKQLDLHIRFLIEEYMHEPCFIDMKYIFEEANYFKIMKRKYDYMSLATKKLNSLRDADRVKSKFIERYFTKFRNLNSNQIHLLVDFAGPKGATLLLKAIRKKIVMDGCREINRGSVALLRRINLVHCLENDMESHIIVFGNKDKYRNLSPDQVDELRKLEEISISEAFSKRPDLRDIFSRKQTRLLGYQSINELRHQDDEVATSSGVSRDGISNQYNRAMTIYNSRFSRKRKGDYRLINIFIKRPRRRLDLEFGENSGDTPDDEAIVQLLEGTKKIPNVTFSFPESLNSFQTTYQINQYSRNKGPYTLDDILEFFSTSNFSFKNLYMFIEYVFVRKAVTLCRVEPSEAEMADYMIRIVAIKQAHGWEKISKLFINDILAKIVIGPSKSLLQMICDNSELTTTDEAFEIISWRGARSTLRSRKYYDYHTIRMGEFIFGDVKKYNFFWRHPVHKDGCSKPGRCGFVLCVVPISKSFNIRLSTRPEDYSDDIHCHPELLDSDNMHLVLRRDFSTKGKSAMDSQRSYPVHISWIKKPIFYNNHVFWCGEMIPDNAYIAIIVYYSLLSLEIQDW